MTHRTDVARGRDVVARWCALAERRLEYLTELFETGRWRRYFSERGFLENIQEAKAAVEIWRELSTREASPDNFAIDISWLGRTRATRAMLPSGETSREWVHRFQPQPSPPPRDVLVAAEPDHVYSDAAPSAPEPDAPALETSLDTVLDSLTRDIAAIAERYPLLRNVM
jgi:TIGR03809 family protein